MLAPLAALALSVATTAAQTATPAAGTTTTAAQTGGPLGLSWWVWLLLALLLLFLLWWFFLRRRPAPPLPPEPPRRSATYQPPATPAAPFTPIAPATNFEPSMRGVMPEVPLPVEAELNYMEPEESLVEPDNLKRIEGIGPRIESILNGAGINTFRQLSTTPVERLREILVAAELRGSFGDPTSWPEQARLAAEGLWDELQALQNGLRGGR